MGTTHEETGRRHSGGGTPESPVAVGQAAGRPAALASAAGRREFDPRPWLLADASRRRTWQRRVGLGAAAGIVGALGWMAAKQLPLNAARASGNDSTEVLDANDENSLSEIDVNDSLDVLKTHSGPGPSFEWTSRSATTALDAPAMVRNQSNPAAAAARHAASTDNPFDTESGARDPRSAARRDHGPASVPATLSDQEWANDEPRPFQRTQQAIPIHRAAEGSARNNAWVKTPALPELPRTAQADSPSGGDPFGESVVTATAETEDARVHSNSESTSAGGLLQESDDDVWGTPDSSRSGRAIDRVSTVQSEAEFATEVIAERTAPGAMQPHLAPATADSLAEPAARWPDAATVETGTAGLNVDGYSAPRGFSAPFEPQEIAPAAVFQPSVDDEVHVVQTGENYWSIARQHYAAGRYFGALAEYNRARISDPRKLKPGMKVMIPPAETLEARYAKLLGLDAAAERAQAPQGLSFTADGHPQYRVGDSDSLSSIAQRHLGRSSRWQEIYELNRETLKSANKVKAGMILRMPDDASQVEAAAAGPVNR